MPSGWSLQKSVEEPVNKHFFLIKKILWQVISDEHTLLGPGSGIHCSEQPVSCGTRGEQSLLGTQQGASRQTAAHLLLPVCPSFLVPPPVRAGSEEEIRPDQPLGVYCQTAESGGEEKQQTSTQS